MANDILTIDGTTYAINAIELVETSDFADKFAERTEDWDLQREIAGIFFNYELALGDKQDQVVLQAVWNKMHEPVNFHTVILPHDEGLQTFIAYVTGASRKLLKRKDGVNRWGGYVIKFVAKKPQITP